MGPQSGGALHGETHGRIVDGIALTVAVLTALGILYANTHSLYNLRRLDVLTFYLPWYEHLGERLRSGDLPGWLPYTLSGAPFAGDPQSGWGYLPAMISFTISPSLTGYWIFLAFHLILASTGAYLYARVVGVRSIGALMVSVAFANGNMTERVACCTIHMQVAVWIPFIYLTIEMALRSASWRPRFAWLTLGGIASGQMMSGWIGQGAYYGALAVAAYAIVRFVMHHGGRWRWSSQLRQLVMLGSTLAVMSAATLIPALLPRLDTVSRSNLSDLYSDGNASESSGWDATAFVRELFSYQNGTGTTYLGIVLLMLATVGVIAFFRRPRVPFFVCFLLTGLALISANSPVEHVFALLPRFNSLHHHRPDRTLIVLLLPLAVLAGWLLDGILEPDRTRRCGRLLAIFAIAVAGGLLCLVDVTLRVNSDEPLNQDRLRIAIVALIVITLGLLIPRRWIGLAAAIALIALLLWDPTVDRISGRFSSRYTERSKAPVDAYTQSSPAAEWIQAQYRTGGLFRYFGYDEGQLLDEGDPRTYHIVFSERATYQLIVNNLAVRAELQDIQGYNPVQIQRYVTYFDVLNGTEQSYHGSNVLAAGLDSPLIELLGVRYMVVPASVPSGRPDLFHLSQRLPTVYMDEWVRILEIPNPMPRAWIVYRSVNAESESAILEQISQYQMDPRTSVGLIGQGPVLTAPDPSDPVGVTITSYAPDQIKLHVQSAGTGMVVLSEIWDPGWSATVDGQPVEVYAADGVFRGIVVGPGEHTVVLTYKATLAKMSLLAWLIPLISLLALHLPIWSKHPNTRSTRPATSDSSRL
jgi:hypothetical protein